MKNVITTLLTFIPFFIFSQNTLEILSSIPCPNSSIGDITNDGTHLYLNKNDDDEIYKIDPATGNVLESYTLNNLNNAESSIAFDDGRCWVAGEESNGGFIIQNVNLSTGDVLKTFPIPANTDVILGMEVVGQQLYVNARYFNTNPDSILVFDFDGNLLARHSTELNHVHGLTYDGNHFIMSANIIQNGMPVGAYIYKYDPTTFEKLDSVSTTISLFPGGLTWFQDGLWFEDNLTDSIYHISIDFNTNTFNIPTQSAQIFPNPTSDFLNIKIENPEPTQITIFDSFGKKVFEKMEAAKSDIQLSTAELPSGVYFITIQLQNQSFVQKFIKIE